MPTKILSLGKDPAIVRSRNIGLEREGYAVTAATSVEEGLELIASRKFDLAIVGYTFTRAEKRELVTKIKAAGVPVLLLYLEHSEPNIPASAHVNVFDGSSHLLATVAAMLPKPASRLEIVDYHFVHGDLRGGPSDPENLYQEMMVSVKGHEPGKLRTFSIQVCTPSGLVQSMHDPGRHYRFARNLLLVEKYDINLILDAIQQEIEHLALYATEIVISDSPADDKMQNAQKASSP